MRAQMLSAISSILTQLTLERPFSGVRAHVPLHVVRAVAHIVALVARERFRACVRELVQLALALSTECTWAVSALAYHRRVGKCKQCVHSVSCERKTKLKQ